MSRKDRLTSPNQYGTGTFAVYTDLDPRPPPSVPFPKNSLGMPESLVPGEEEDLPDK